MSKATKDQATEAGFDTAKEYNAFLDNIESDHDRFMALSETDREGWIRQWDGGNGADTDSDDTDEDVDSDFEAPEEDGKPRRDLSPSALGFSVQNVKDIDPSDLPDFAIVNSKYGEYFKALDDSYEHGFKWKHVADVDDVPALGQALRTAANKRGYGLEYKYTQNQETGEPDGNVYFRAQEKRAKKANGSGSDVTD